ncbi:MAG: signal recognition particle protein [Clostridiales bacterium]|nr:signal recognition particle protein [Clostridiales bacterium]
MAFESLADKLQDTFKFLKGKGKLSEKDIKDAMREIKLALLEADVNFMIVKKFIKTVSERAVGEEVMKSLTPGQMVVKIVNEELTSLMGEKVEKLDFASQPPTVIMLCGLQGAGKTTMAGKLGNFIKGKGKRPLLAACDIYRPAAIKQLQVVGGQLDIPVFSMGQEDPRIIAREALKEAQVKGYDVLIIDTAGRLHIDEALMDELEDVKGIVKPHEILLVIDAMTGQDAVNVAETFDKKLDVNGVILTKLDGDSRGGAALSVRAVTGKPIKFVGVGEKLTDLEEFHPDRMASRILGMGDVLSLIEKAQLNMDEDKMKKLESKMRKNEFDLEDFLDQLQQMKNMGPIGDLLKMIPGMNSKAMKGIDVDEKEFVRLEAIIQSMTPEERKNPQLINANRRKRIALGSGSTVNAVNKLLKQHAQTKKMMKQFNNPAFAKKMKKGGMGLPF